MNTEGNEIRIGDALVVVDVQRDFLPGGALAVPEGDTVVAPLNRCANAFARRGLPVLATREWHPVNHRSFVTQGGPWPPHCVAGTPGAEMAPELELPPGTPVIAKAATPDNDAYSGFVETDLEQRLRDRGCRRVVIGGLATDYCVRATVLDALRAGFDVVVVEEAVRPVEVSPGDGARALDEMIAHGARVLHLGELLR